MSSEIKVGLTEAAHITSDVRSNIFVPLSKRIEEANTMGFETYEAMPGWSTAAEIIRKNSGGRFETIRKGVVNIHQSWFLDRWVSPRPAENDTALGYLMRYPTSLVTSVPFIGNSVVRRLSEITDASVSTHWPMSGDMQANTWEGRRRRENQRLLDSLEGGVIVENHVMLGMTNAQMRQWLKEGRGKRGFAFVSGRDVRDGEYGGQSGVDPRLFLADTRGIYVKEGWDEDVLRGDLRTVLGTNPEHDLWLMVNYPDGSSRKTAEKLLEIVEKVKRG